MLILKTLKKKRTRQAIVESVDGRGSPFYLKKITQTTEISNQKELIPKQRKVSTREKNTEPCELIVTFL